MAAGPIAIGQHGERLAEEVVRLRGLRGWDQRTLAAQVAKCGRTLSASVLGKIEAKTRRVDADDLVALAEALEVSVTSLLGLAEPEVELVLPSEPQHGKVEAQVADDIEALGDLDGMAPTLAELALKLAREIDRTAENPRALPALARELREVVGALAPAAADDDDDDDGLGDLDVPA